MVLDRTTLFEKFITYWNANISVYSEKKPIGLYSPIHYIAQGGGKRMRPVFALMAANLFSDEVEAALPAGFCVELFHNFTLVHDDIMDEAPLRRGRVTIHEKWDTNTAILSGDLMMIEALRHLDVVQDPGLRCRISDCFLAGAIAVCEGQQYDVDFETRDDVTLEEYIEMIRLKTAALLAEGMAMGAACGGADVAQTDLIRRFGYGVGTAFQIQDDILDTFGDPEKFGKKVGGDIAQNKKTFLYLKALEVTDEATKKQIAYYYNTENEVDEKEKIEAVTRIFEESGIRKIAEAEKRKYTEDAFRCLDELGLDEGRVSYLKEFASWLVDRDF